MATLTGITDLGEINTETVKKNANLFILPIARGDDTAAEVEDFTGVITTISITGKRKIGGAETKSTIVAEFLALIDGSQDTTITYSSDVSGSHSVFVQSVDVTNNQANTESFDYTVKLVRGT